MQWRLEPSSSGSALRRARCINPNDGSFYYGGWNRETFQHQGIGAHYSEMNRYFLHSRGIV